MNFKKIICILLVAVFSLNLLTAFADGETVVVAGNAEPVSEETLQAYNILKTIGALKYDLTDESFGANVTNAEMVGAIIDLLGSLSDTCKYSEYDVTDIEKEPEADKIQLAYDLGLVSQKPMFFPERSVTFGEAIEMLVKILGYQDIVSNTKINGAYIVVANRIGLIDNISINSDVTLVWNDFIGLLSQAAEVELMVDYAYTSPGNIVHKQISDTCLLNEFFDVYKVEGVVNSNQYTDIDNTVPVGEGFIKIGNSVLKSGGFDTSGMIGYYVEGFAKEVDGKYTLLSYNISSQNDILEIDADTLVPDDIAWSKYCIAYEGRNGKVKRLSLPRDISVVYNGMKEFAYIADDLNIDKGKLIAINNDSDSDIDVLLVKEYINYIVDSVDKIYEIIYTKNTDTSGKHISFNYGSDDADFKLNSVDESEFPWSDMGMYTILSLCSSRDNSLVRGYAVNNNITGKITSYGTDNGKIQVGIGSEEYIVSNSWNTIAYEEKPIVNGNSMGKTYMLFFDEMNEIVAFAPIETSGYGFLMGCKSDGIFEKTAQVKVFSYMGREEIYTLNKTVSVYNNSTHIIERGVSGADAVMNPNYGLVDLSGSVVNGLVKFELNDNGNIYKIYPAIDKSVFETYPLSDEDMAEIMVKECKKNLDWRASSSSLGQLEYGVSPFTRVMCTPQRDGKYCYDDFFAGTSTLLLDQRTMSLSLYDLTETKVPRLIVIESDLMKIEPWRNGAYLVKNVLNGYDEEKDETYIAIDCINKDKNVELRFKDEDVYKNVAVKGIDGIDYTTEIEPGDVIVCHFNIDGRIDGVGMIFDKSKYTNVESIPSGVLSQDGTMPISSEISTYCGTITHKDNLFVAIDTGRSVSSLNIFSVPYIYSVKVSETDGNRIFTKSSPVEIHSEQKILVSCRYTNEVSVILLFED